MAGRLAARSVSRTLLEFGTKAAGSRATCRRYGTALRRTATALPSGRCAFLLGLPVISCLGYAVYRKVRSPVVVCALERAPADELLEQADQLYSSSEKEKLYQLLLQFKDSEDAQVLWRLARASRDMALMPNMEASRKKKLMFEAFDFVSKALEKDDQCFACHRWYGVCLSDVGEYRGLKAKIGNSYIIRQHMERAVQLNPRDATSYYILGQWCFTFAELPWYQRNVTSMVFTTPPTATYEEALSFFLKAEEAEPNFYSSNLLMLGKTYLALKDKENARVWLTKAKDYPRRTDEEKSVHREAVDLLKKLG